MSVSELLADALLAIELAESRFRRDDREIAADLLRTAIDRLTSLQAYCV